MTPNVVALALLLTCGGAAPAGPSDNLQFPFKSPPGALISEPSSLPTELDFGAFCYRFVYSAVKLCSRRASKGTLSEQITSLCRENEHSRCRTWAIDLQDIVDAKKGKTKGKSAGSYRLWCSKVYSAQGKGEPASISRGSVDRLAEAVVDTKSSAAQHKHANQKVPPLESKRMLAHASSVRRPQPVQQVAHSKSEQNHAASKHSQAGHSVFSHKHAVPPHVAPKRTQLHEARTPTSNQHPARWASKLASKATVKPMEATPTPSSTTHTDERRALSDPEHCACVHRDGKEVCHCEAEKKTASLASQNIGDVIRGMTIAVEASSVTNQSEINGAVDSLSNALKSSIRLKHDE